MGLESLCRSVFFLSLSLSLSLFLLCSNIGGDGGSGGGGGGGVCGGCRGGGGVVGGGGWVAAGVVAIGSGLSQTSGNFCRCFGSGPSLQRANLKFSPAEPCDV